MIVSTLVTLALVSAPAFAAPINPPVAVDVTRRGLLSKGATELVAAGETAVKALKGEGEVYVAAVKPQDLRVLNEVKKTFRWSSKADKEAAQNIRQNFNEWKAALQAMAKDKTNPTLQAEAQNTLEELKRIDGTQNLANGVVLGGTGLAAGAAGVYGGVKYAEAHDAAVTSDSAATTEPISDPAADVTAENATVQRRGLFNFGTPELAEAAGKAANALKNGADEWVAEVSGTDLRILNNVKIATFLNAPDRQLANEARQGLKNWLQAMEEQAKNEDEAVAKQAKQALAQFQAIRGPTAGQKLKQVAPAVAVGAGVGAGVGAAAGYAGYEYQASHGAPSSNAVTEDTVVPNAAPAQRRGLLSKGSVELAQAAEDAASKLYVVSDGVKELRFSVVAEDFQAIRDAGRKWRWASPAAKAKAAAAQNALDDWLVSMRGIAQLKTNPVAAANAKEALAMYESTAPVDMAKVKTVAGVGAASGAVGLAAGAEVAASHHSGDAAAVAARSLEELD